MKKYYIYSLIKGHKVQFLRTLWRLRCIFRNQHWKIFVIHNQSIHMSIHPSIHTHQAKPHSLSLSLSVCMNRLASYPVQTETPRSVSTAITVQVLLRNRRCWWSEHEYALNTDTRVIKQYYADSGSRLPDGQRERLVCIMCLASKGQERHQE